MAQPLNLTTGIVFLQPNAILPITGSITLGPGADLTGYSTSVIRFQMATPASPTPVADNGSGALAAGTYQITVVAVDSNGGLTLFPTAQGIVTAGGTSHIDVGYVLPAGAVAMRVYTSAANGATPDRYFTSTNPVTYALTTLAGATVAALPTTANAYKASIGGSATFNWFSMPLALNTGTVTTAVSPLLITQVANNAAVVFPGIKFVMTEGASGTAAGTNLLDLWYGTSGAEASKFSVTKSGGLSLSGSIVTNGTSYLFSGAGGFTTVSDGVINIRNSLNTGFTTLNLGPTAGNTASGATSIKQTVIACVIDTDTNCTGHGTATITTSTGIPAGSIVLGVTARVITTIAGSNGIATWALGCTVGPLNAAANTTAWGAALNLAATTVTNASGFTINPSTWTTASTITFSGTSGKIIDSGAVTITIHYIQFTPIGV